MSFEVLDPSGKPAAETRTAPRLRTSLDNGRIGVIWNGRPNGDTVLRHILDDLTARHEMDVAVFEKKPLIGNMAPDEMYRTLENTPINFLLAGVGD